MDTSGTPAASALRSYALDAGQGQAVWYVNNRATILASAAQTGGAFGLVEMQVAIGHGPPFIFTTTRTRRYGSSTGT
jgi:hypothetical protein